MESPEKPTPEEVARYRADYAISPEDRRPGNATKRAVAKVWLIQHGLLESEAEPEPPPRPSTIVLDSAIGNPTPKAIAEEHRKNQPRPRLDMTSMDDVEEEDIQWLWPGRIPLGALTTIMGRMGNGKSTLRDWLTSTVSAGHPWPDCPDDNPPGTVLILQAEESKSRVIKHRLNAFAYGHGKVFTVNGLRFEDGFKSWFSLRHDVGLLAEKCVEIGDVRLILVDPIGAYLRGIKGNNDVEVRECLQPLKEFAEEEDLAVVLIAHPNKDGDKDILDRLSGSAAFGQIVRSMWYLSEDPRDNSRRLLSLMKENTPGMTKTAISLHYDDRKRVMTWFPEPVKLSARQVDHILQREAREAKLKARMGRPLKEARAAEEFLIKLLECGPASLSVAREKAMLLGISFSTLRRAINDLCSDGRKAVERYEIDANGETRVWFRLAEPPAPGTDPTDASDGASQ